MKLLIYHIPHADRKMVPMASVDHDTLVAVAVMSTWFLAGTVVDTAFLDLLQELCLEFLRFLLHASGVKLHLFFRYFVIIDSEHNETPFAVFILL